MNRRRAYVIATGLALCVITLIPLMVYFYIHRETVETCSFSDVGKDCFTGYGQWTTKDGQRTLRQMIMFEEGSSSALYITNDWKQRPGNGYSYSSSGPLVNVDVLPSGIYTDEVPLPTTQEVRVYILMRDNSLTPFLLSPAELSQFTPDFARYHLVSTALWKDRILPLVRPREIRWQKEAAALALEKQQQAEFAASGIKLCRIYGESRWQSRRDDLFYVGDWHEHPNGTLTFLNAFLTRQGSLNPTHHSSDYEGRSFEQSLARRPPGSLRVCLELFPTHYEIEGKSMERGKPYVQLADGSVTVLELTTDEWTQFTRDQLTNRDQFMKSELFLNKIAPLLGPIIPAPL